MFVSLNPNVNEIFINSKIEEFHKLFIECIAKGMQYCGFSIKLVNQSPQLGSRILAPVLHCSYDELKQRHKMYRMYRLLGIAAVIMCFLSVFAGYALFQSKKSQEEYLTTRKNQARYLCNISNNLLQTGDRMGALKTALAILPENKKENKPIVPEQFYLDNLLYFLCCILFEITMLHNKHVL